MFTFLYNSNIKSIKSGFIAFVFLAEIVFIKSVFANDHERANINTSDSTITVLGKIIESNFFLSPESCNAQGSNSNSQILTSDLIFEYRLSELNKHTSINLEYNIYVKEYIEKYITERAKNISVILNLSTLYSPVFEQKLREYNLPLELKYLAVVESSLNPLACSSSGAIGLWQLLHDTGKMLLQESNELLEQSMTNKGMQKIWHIVNREELINDIAKKYGCDVVEIINWNHLVFNKVNVGQELAIWIRKKDIFKK